MKINSPIDQFFSSFFEWITAKNDTPINVRDAVINIVAVRAVVPMISEESRRKNLFLVDGFKITLSKAHKTRGVKA